ncbi:hypothetical protein E3N88_27013 [Mikania micrantha]|uniref:Uncharacterized protein n=1 Tax=Mikania micrantha TaxID=192012 RepID=A0A5N6MYF7_9ASTR|nr:hypothetical protein E3N88_27013 [Mikania micrantha]
MGAAQAMKRIPRIKFPQRHPKPSGSTTQTQATPAASDVPSTFFSRSAPSDKTLGGKASLQPKRTPMTQEEIDAIMLRYKMTDISHTTKETMLSRAFVFESSKNITMSPMSRLNPYHA